MNNTNINKLTRRKAKVKQSYNKESGTDTGALTDGHLLKKGQQDLKHVKRNLKSKNANNNCDINDTKEGVICDADMLEQYPEYVKIGRKKFTVKESSCENHNFHTAEVSMGELQRPSHQVEEKLDTKLQVKLNSDIKTAETVANSSQTPEQENDLEFYHKKTYIFMKTLKRDYKRLALIYNSCVMSEQERQKRNEEEIDRLKKIYNQMQVERTNIKRKRWCRYCESEATYLSSIGTNFYCSIQCEQKQNDLVNAVDFHVN